MASYSSSSDSEASIDTGYKPGDTFRKQVRVKASLSSESIGLVPPNLSLGVIRSAILLRTNSKSLTSIRNISRKPCLSSMISSWIMFVKCPLSFLLRIHCRVLPRVGFSSSKSTNSLKGALNQKMKFWYYILHKRFETYFFEFCQKLFSFGRYRAWKVAWIQGFFARPLKKGVWV